jgi:hypothetical protein
MKGDAKPETLWDVHFDTSDPSRTPKQVPNTQHFYFSPDYQLFAFGMPSPKAPPTGDIFHLMDRRGHLWKMPGEDNGAYYSPYEVVGFTDGGKSIIAHDTHRLFTIPVSAIEDDANVVKRDN